MTLQKQNYQRNIYLADDDDDDRLMFAEALSEIDNSVQLTQAEDGKALMDILSVPSSPIPEVIILDINMPRKNGFECLEEIRNHQGNLKDLNVIMFSTSNDPRTIVKAFELGASFYAVKPNSFQELKTLIHDILHMDWVMPKQENRKFQLA